MCTTTGAREKAILTQTLAPLLVGLVGCRDVIIDLKNELQVCGLIHAVDCFMNVTITNAQMSSPNGPISKFDFIFVQRGSIRSIQIPSHVRVQNLLKNQVDIVTGVKAREARRKAKEKRAKYLLKKEKKNMEQISE